jgi:hypothetical protein
LTGTKYLVLNGERRDPIPWLDDYLFHLHSRYPLHVYRRFEETHRDDATVAGALFLASTLGADFARGDDFPAEEYVRGYLSASRVAKWHVLARGLFFDLFFKSHPEFAFRGSSLVSPETLIAEIDAHLEIKGRPMMETLRMLYNSVQFTLAECEERMLALGGGAWFEVAMHLDRAAQEAGWDGEVWSNEVAPQLADPLFSDTLTAMRMLTSQ